MNPKNVRLAFSMLSHVARVRINSLPTMALAFTAKSWSCHVHSTLRLTPSTTPCPTYSADAELAWQHAETAFSVQCKILWNQKFTIGSNRNLSIHTDFGSVRKDDNSCALGIV